jgi:hypothetical protein
MPRAHFGDEQRQAGKTKAKDSRTSAKRRKVAHVALSWIWLVQKKSAEQEDEMSEAAQQPAMDEGTHCLLKLELFNNLSPCCSASHRMGQDACEIDALA